MTPGRPEQCEDSDRLNIGIAGSSRRCRDARNFDGAAIRKCDDTPTPLAGSVILFALMIISMPGWLVSTFKKSVSWCHDDKYCFDADCPLVGRRNDFSCDDDASQWKNYSNYFVIIGDSSITSYGCTRFAIASDIICRVNFMKASH